MDARWMMGSPCDAAAATSEDEAVAAAAELRRGAWTAEEDAALMGYVAAHGEGRWNDLARAAGLRRTGKSCRLRWLNYLRPGVRRGDFTAREQLLILDLHSRWGNRWSKIAAHLPGRTDNEVKNYWRTRVQKHARQLGCDVGSRRFHDAVRHLWMPRLLERVHADDDDAAAAAPSVLAHQSAAWASHRTEQCASSPDASCLTGSSSVASPPLCHLSPPPTTVADAAAAGWSDEQCRNWGSPSATSGDMFDGTWSELLARACNDDADSAAGLPDFGSAQTVDDSWSFEDICWLQQLC